LGDAYRKLNDYESAMAAYRKADVLAKEPQMQPVEAKVVTFKEESSNSSDAVQGISQGEAAKKAPDLNVGALPLELSVEKNVENTFEAHLIEGIAETSTELQTEVSTESTQSTQQEGSPDFIKMFDDSTSMESESDGDFIKWLEGLSSNEPVADVVEECSSCQTTYSNIENSQVLATSEIQGTETVAEDSVCEPGQIAQDPEEIPAPESAGNDALLSAIKEVVARLPHGEADSPIEHENAIVEEAGPIPDNSIEEPSQKIEIPTAAPVPLHQESSSISAQIWNELGNIYYNIVAYDEAIKALNKALELDQSYAWTYNNLASIYIHKGNFADAVPLLQQGIPLMNEPKDKALLWNRLGDTYRRMDQHEKAADAYQKAMELNPENVSLLTRARFSLLGNCQA